MTFYVDYEEVKKSIKFFMMDGKCFVLNEHYSFDFLNQRYNIRLYRRSITANQRRAYDSYQSGLGSAGI